MAQRLTPSIGQSGGSGLVDPLKANRPYLVDTYERPGPSPLAGLAESLGQFNRSLSGAFNASMAGKDQENADEEAKGRLAVAQAGSFSEAQRRGLIPANANPFFMAGANDYEGRARAYQAHLEIQKQFQNDPIKNEVDTAKQAEWVQAQFDQRLQGMDNDYTRAGFLRTIGPMRQQLLGEFGKQAAVNATTRMWDGAGAEIDGVVGTSRVTGGLDSVLAGRESGGRYDIVNPVGYAGKYQVGAPLLATIGLYIPGPGENIRDANSEGRWSGNKWGGEFNIPGYPGVKTMADFLTNEGAQEKAFQMAKEHNWKALENNGAAKAVGTVINGVKITQDGLIAGAHLAGTEGVRKWIESGGKVNPKDRNGTSVSDYMALGARTSGVTDSVTPAPTNILAVRDSLEQMRHKLYYTQGQTGAEIDQFIVDKLIATAIQTRDVSLLDVLRMDRKDLLDPSKPFPSYASNPKVAAAVASAEQTIKSRLAEDATKAYQAHQRDMAQRTEAATATVVRSYRDGGDPQAPEVVAARNFLAERDPAWQSKENSMLASHDRPLSVRERHAIDRQMLTSQDPLGLLDRLLDNPNQNMSREDANSLRAQAEALAKQGGGPNLTVVEQVANQLESSGKFDPNSGAISPLFDHPGLRMWVANRFRRLASDYARQHPELMGQALRSDLELITMRVVNEEAPKVFPDQFARPENSKIAPPARIIPTDSVVDGAGKGGKAAAPPTLQVDPQNRWVQILYNDPTNKRANDGFVREYGQTFGQFLLSLPPEQRKHYQAK